MRSVLDNGLTWLYEPMHHSPVVAVQVWVKTGSADEREGEFGLAHLHEHMLFKGTERRGPGQIAKDIEAHLQKKVRQVDEDPVLADQAVCAAPEIHHAHTDSASSRRQAEEAATEVRRTHARPAGRGDIRSFGDATLVVAADAVREGGEKRPLVHRLVVRKSTRRADAGRPEPHHPLDIPVAILLHAPKRLAVVAHEPADHRLDKRKTRARLLGIGRNAAHAVMHRRTWNALRAAEGRREWPAPELAQQIHKVAAQFGASSRIKAACVYGGAPKVRPFVLMRVSQAQG